MVTTAFEGRQPVLAVTFADIELIAKGLKPPFDFEHGDYKAPDLAMAAWEMHGEIPNDVIAQAVRNAEQMADQIACEADYKRTVRLIWKGWSCRPGRNGFIASAAEEVEIICGG